MKTKRVIKNLKIEELQAFIKGQEVWRRCPYFKIKYEVSNLGNYRNRSTKRLLKAQESSNGYLLYYPNINGKNFGKLAHRLVSLAFYEMSESLEVNHIDLDKKNNNLLNLEPATKRENTDHAMQYKRYDQLKKIKDNEAIRYIDGRKVVLPIV